MKYESFWRDLWQNKDPAAVRAVFGCCPPVAAVIGLDGNPEARPVSPKSGEGDALFFEAARSTRLYAELSTRPGISLLCRDPEGDAFLRIGAKVIFAEDEEADRAGIAVFFLTGAEAELTVEGEEKRFVLPDPAGVLRGITIRKKTELRDRLSKILLRLEEGGPGSVSEDPFTVKLYDGALFLFAEEAKKLWPRMDVQPMERSSVYETWDERESFVRLAKRLIGNAVIAEPEDMTYWLNPETLTELYKGSL